MRTGFYFIQKHFYMAITFAARRTLTAAFMQEEILRIAQKINHGSAFVDNENRAGTDDQIVCIKIFVSVRHIQNAVIGNFAGSAAELN